MTKALAVTVLLSVVFGVPAALAGEQAEVTQSGVTTLGEDQLPPPLVLGDWVIFVGSILEQEGAGAAQYLREYGIDPSVEVQDRFRALFRRFSGRFPPSELAKRYRESSQPEEVVQRQWRSERARFLGREIGALLRFLEDGGAPIDLIVTRVLDSRTFSTSRTFIDEVPDPELLREEAADLRSALFEALGRDVRAMEKAR